MTEEKKLLFLNRRHGEKIEITLGDEIVEVIIKETTRTSVRVGIRANEVVKIRRLDAEPETLEAMRLRKIDKAASKKLKDIERMKGLVKGIHEDKI